MHHKEETLEQLQKHNQYGRNEAADSDPIEMSEPFQLQLARLSSTNCRCPCNAFMAVGYYEAVSPSPESKDT